jgi:DNA-binding transcriptional LysR family regulator
MDFDLRLLRHARALAEEGSFARASRNLHLTQPALSRSIQDLERRTGIKLFDRNKGRVEPTDLGRVFLAHARELLGRAEALDREVATMRGSGTGSLVVGSGSFPTSMFMGGAVSAFLRRNPGVGVRLVNSNWVALVAALRRRELDFIVAAPPVADEATDLVVRPLSLRQGYFLVRPGHPLRMRRELCLEDIAACPIMCVGHLAPAITERLLEARPSRDAARPVPDVACDSLQLMAQIAGATDHVLLSTLSANENSISAGELVALPVIEPKLSVTFAVLRLAARTLPSIADDFIREVIAADRAGLVAERELAAQLSKAPSVPIRATKASTGRGSVRTRASTPAQP